jgi:hypothetical protein
VPGRSAKLLWGGMAVFLAGAAMLMQAGMPAALSFLVYLAMVAGWVAGACGMVGYVRWLFRRNLSEHKEKDLE